MTAFRSLSLVLAALLFPGIVRAGNPGVICTFAPSNPPLLRAEGVSERVADIVLTCTGGNNFQTVSGAPLPYMQFTLTFSANITSRLLNTSVTPNVSEALLLVDEPGSPSNPQTPQTVCSSAMLGAVIGGCPQYPVTVGSTTVMSSSPYSAAPPANVYQGLWNSAAPNQITFPGVPILAPVLAGVTRTFRITNLRVDASSLGTSGFIGTQPISVSISMSGGNASLAIRSPVETVGYGATSLSAETINPSGSGSLTPPTFSPCEASSIIPVALLQFTENFAAAFETRVQQTGSLNSGQQPSLTQNVPGAIYNSESGFTLQTPNGPAGLADYGTRLKAVFHGVPSGVRLFVSVNNVVNSSPPSIPEAGLVTGETALDSTVAVGGGLPAYPAVFATTVVSGVQAAEIVPDSTGTATAVWEMIYDNPAILDQSSFAVYILLSNAVTPSASATVNLSYAPTPPPGSSSTQLQQWGEASSTLTLPRFAQTSTAQSLFSTGYPGFCVGPQLSLTETHAGGFASGSNGNIYTIVVNDIGLQATSGTVNVADTLPAGLTATAISGTGWSCSLSPLGCSRNDSLNAGASYPAIIITVSVASSAIYPVINQVTASGGGSTTVSTTDLTFLGSGLSGVTLISPAQGATGVGPYTTLTWSSLAGGAYYQVNVGTTPSPPGIDTTTATSFTLLLNPGTTYYWSISAVSANGTVVSAVQSFTTAGSPGGGPPGGGSGSASYFVPVTPCRVFDTRNAAGTFGGPTMTPGSTRSVPIPSGSCGIPTSATAYSMNVTVVPHGVLNYLTIWPAGQAQPYVSTLNSPNGTVVANAAIVPAGLASAGYGVTVYVSDTTDVILDVNGYFAPETAAGALSLYQVAPCRIVDTRATNSAFGGYVVGGSTRTLNIPAGPCGVPGTAAAYSLNITVVPHGPLQYLTVWPAGTAQPNVSTLNSYSGIVVANAAIVPGGGPFAGPGAIDVYATNDTDLVIDINGYFAAPGSAGALAFYPLTPCRAADTRYNGGALGGGSQRQFGIAQSSCGVPQSAVAYALNVTAVPSGPLGYLTAWPTGQAQPVVSTLNSPTGAVVANAAIVSASGGSISVFVSDPSNVVLDINGYFGQ